MSLDESPSLRMMPMRPAGVLGMVTMSVPAAATLTGRRSCGSSSGVAPNGGENPRGRSGFGGGFGAPPYPPSAGGGKGRAAGGGERRRGVLGKPRGRLLGGQPLFRVTAAF